MGAEPVTGTTLLQWLETGDYKILEKEADIY